MTKVLQCSTRGCALGKKFSAFNAIVTFNGKTCSIEQHYQESKLINGKQLPMKEAKGKKIDGFMFRGYKLGPELMTSFYYYLWAVYYDNNKDLVNKARQFDKFEDMFRGKSINCQADTIQLWLTDQKAYVAKIKPLADKYTSLIQV